jgi:predicted methyltransferase
MIQVQRGDFNGKVLTVRADDVRAIAAMLNVATEDVAATLEDLGLLFRPTA